MRLSFQIGLVALGSALGGLLRWSVGEAALFFLGTGFPWGTLFINLSGSLFLGWFATVLSERLPNLGGLIHPDDLRLLIAVGFTGAYTTFSTYAYESQKLLSEGADLLGMTYLLASVFFGLVAVRFGVFLARWR